MVYREAGQFSLYFSGKLCGAQVRNVIRLRGLVWQWDCFLVQCEKNGLPLQARRECNSVNYIW